MVARVVAALRVMSADALAGGSARRGRARWRATTWGRPYETAAALADDALVEPQKVLAEDAAHDRVAVPAPQQFLGDAREVGDGLDLGRGMARAVEVGTKADDRDDYLIYNKKTGVLYYDADGSGSAKQVEIAKLSKNLKMNEKDFFVI